MHKFSLRRVFLVTKSKSALRDESDGGQLFPDGRLSLIALTWLLYRARIRRFLGLLVRLRQRRRRSRKRRGRAVAAIIVPIITITVIINNIVIVSVVANAAANAAVAADAQAPCLSWALLV